MKASQGQYSTSNLGHWSLSRSEVGRRSSSTAFYQCLFAPHPHHPEAPENTLLTYWRCALKQHASVVAIATRRDNSNILLGGVWGARGQEVDWTQIAFLQQTFCCLVNILLESPSQLRGNVPELPMLAQAPRCSVWRYPLIRKMSTEIKPMSLIFSLLLQI